MTNHHLEFKLLTAIALGFWIFGCPQKPDVQTQELNPILGAKEVVLEKKIETQQTQQVDETQIKKSTVNDQNWIAMLKSSTNRVDFKSKSDGTWQAVTSDMNFYKFDSVQTQQQSTALVRYQSKSELDVKEKTLLVFDEDPGAKKKKVDRVILKAGDLLGKTNSELWILTDSGLVQISADKLKPGKARVQIKNDQFKIVVDQGTALVTIKNKNNEIQKIAVTQNNSVNLDTKKQLLPIVNDNYADQTFDSVVNQAMAIEKPTEQKVDLDNVSETEFTKKTVYQLSGQLSAVGAKLLVNGEIVQVGPDLKFLKDVKLTKGSNLIVLQVIRSDSTTQFIRKKVVLED